MTRISRLTAAAVLALCVVATPAIAGKAIPQQYCYTNEDGTQSCYGSAKTGAKISWASWLYDASGNLLSYFTGWVNVVNGNNG